jgi:hypothetical protein
MKKKKGRSHAIPAALRGYVRTAGYYKGGSAGNELKFHDLDINDAGIAQGGTIAEDSCLTIAQGDGESERIGRKCTVKSVNWRFAITLPSTGTQAATTDVVRVILYLDKQTNGATAGVTDILESDDFQSFNNLANKSRFRTLLDRTYDMNVEGAGAGASWASSAKTITDSFYLSCNLPIEYDNSATTGAIATMRSNNIGVLLLSESGLCAFESKMRVRFVG